MRAPAWAGVTTKDIKMSIELIHPAALPVFITGVTLSLVSLICAWIAFSAFSARGERMRRQEVSFKDMHQAATQAHNHQLQILSAQLKTETARANQLANQLDLQREAAARAVNNAMGAQHDRITNLIAELADAKAAHHVDQILLVELTESIAARRSDDANTVTKARNWIAKRLNVARAASQPGVKQAA